MMPRQGSVLTEKDEVRDIRELLCSHMLRGADDPMIASVFFVLEGCDVSLSSCEVIDLDDSDSTIES
jgi:hypothetical protein